MKYGLCVSTAALGFVLATLAPAAATDLGVEPIYKAPLEPVAPWSGSYTAGWGGSAGGTAVLPNNAIGADLTSRPDLGNFGIASGFNFQKGNVVLGYEADSSASGRRAFEFPPNSAFSNDAQDRWLSTFRGRVGYAQDNWLLYATAGGALGNVASTIPSLALSEQHWHLGWTAGGGVEVKLTTDWTAKIEYLYVGLQDKSYFTPAPSVTINQSARPDDHIVRLGVNYKLPWSMLDSFFKQR
jgi:outer membrane immunogenic protein